MRQIVYDEAMHGPNIVFVLLDDLGKEWISCYGATDIETPAIDDLARAPGTTSTPSPATWAS